MERTINEGEEDTFSFTSSPATDLLPSTDIGGEVYRHIEVLSQKIDEFLRNGESKLYDLSQYMILRCKSKLANFIQGKKTKSKW